MSDPPTTGTFCWFECASTDAATVKPFYAALFAWNAEDLPMPWDSEACYTMFRVGDADMAGLYTMSGPHFAGVASHWATYARVESADATIEQALALKGKVVAPAMDVPGAGRIAFLQDPTGASIGLFEPGERSGCGQPQTSHGAMGWSALTTPDTDAAAAFYTGLFGWTAKRDGSYTEFRIGGRSIGGMLASSPEQGHVPPSWLPYVAVDDADACAAKVAELGGHLLAPPTDIPNAGRFAVFTDPAGACLAFIQLQR